MAVPPPPLPPLPHKQNPSRMMRAGMPLPTVVVYQHAGVEESMGMNKSLVEHNRGLLRQVVKRVDPKDFPIDKNGHVTQPRDEQWEQDYHSALLYIESDDFRRGK